jgi:type IX secretion system PorP/SprF family membrane protein
VKKVRLQSFKYLLIVYMLCICTTTKAQQYFNAPIGQYFRNGFLWNPAYAGSKDHPFIYALLKQSWIGFDGAPSLAMLSGDMAFGKNSGAGFTFSSDKSGLLRRTIFSVDYSYKLVFSKTERLRLGISLGTFKERVNNTGISDPFIPTYNDKGMTFDGNLGAVYEKEKFSFSGVLYNLQTSFKKGDQADVAKAHFMASYNFILSSNDQVGISPLISYKTFSASSGIFELGTQVEYKKICNAAFIWQSTGSLAASLGLMLQKIGEVNFSYGTNNKYGYGQQYEIGLGIILP